MCGQQLGVTGYGQYAKYWPLLELWTGGAGSHGGRQCVISSPACHTTQSPNASPAHPTNFAIHTPPPPMQPLCGMGALIPMPPTRLMPPASTNCAVCHFRGMCLAYPAYPPNPQSQTLPQQPAAAGFDCDPGVTPTLLAKAVPLLNIHFHRALLWLCFFQL